MRIVALLLFSLVPLAGCFTLRADVPQEVVRQHIAREEGLELAALCSYEGHDFSEGARVCMTQQQMTCSPDGRWVSGGGC